ncbi:DNA alkylation repair protein [Candidatus Neomarinimicrobiota bacterium]
MTTAADIIAQLQSLGDEHNLVGMARYGIRTDRSFGVKGADLKQLARQYKGHHTLSLDLWDTGWREARILAAYIGDPEALTPELMDAWVHDFDSWDVCDTATNQLFRYNPQAHDKALEWSLSNELFVRRAGFALMAGLALKSSHLSDEQYDPFLERIRATSTDNRNMVKKAVNWALRQIGKRNSALNKRAIALAEQLLLSGDPAARWIASDALKELRGAAVQNRLKAK